MPGRTGRSHRLAGPSRGQAVRPGTPQQGEWLAGLGCAAEALDADRHARHARQAQGGDDGQVGFEHVDRRQLVRQHPLQGLAVEAARLARVSGHPPDVEKHPPVRIVVAQADQALGIDKRHPNFLGQLAPQRVERRLARLELAARQLPAAGHVFAGRALGDQHAARGVKQRAGDDVQLAPRRRLRHAAPCGGRSARLSRHCSARPHGSA